MTVCTCVKVLIKCVFKFELLRTSMWSQLTVRANKFRFDFFVLRLDLTMDGMIICL